MTTFDKREKGFEQKYKHDEERGFKVNVRRNKLLGLWAAALQGLTEEQAEAYAKSVVAADFDQPGDDDVLQKVQGDLAEMGIEMSPERVRREMDRLLDTARQQIEGE